MTTRVLSWSAVVIPSARERGSVACIVGGSASTVIYLLLGVNLIPKLLVEEWQGAPGLLPDVTGPIGYLDAIAKPLLIVGALALARWAADRLTAAAAYTTAVGFAIWGVQAQYAVILGRPVPWNPLIAFAIVLVGAAGLSGLQRVGRFRGIAMVLAISGVVAMLGLTSNFGPPIVGSIVGVPLGPGPAWAKMTGHVAMTVFSLAWVRIGFALR